MENQLETFLKNENIPYERAVSLKEKTWIHCGGIVQFWIEPTCAESLVYTTKFLNSQKIDFYVVGHTSNVFFRDSCNVNVILSTRKVRMLVDKEDYIECDCGVSMKVLSCYCIEKGYKGYEGFIQLPGTVASAMSNNSGCFECEASDVLLELTCLTSENNLVTMTNEEMKYSKRSSILKRKETNIVLIVSVKLKKEIDSRGVEYLRNKAEDNKRLRKQTQNPPAYTLGSVFAYYTFKPLPYLFIVVIRKVCKMLGVDKMVCNRLTNKLLCAVWGELSIIPYMSEYGLNCYVWKNKKAGDLFDQYVKFIKNITEGACLEIEIKS